ncbi:MAG: NUMOD3 domain-containing DNA-binding protein [Melioribacteraceae bacterium]
METYFIIYKTTCVITNKFYIGMHKTNNLQDGYLGSGTILKRSVNKYGIENHNFEILEYLPDINSLIEREREIVNETLIKESLCMNLKTGGRGGFCNEEHQLKCQKAGGLKGPAKTMVKYHLEKLKGPTYKEKWQKSMSDSCKGEKNGFFGKQHNLETLPTCKKVAQIEMVSGEIIKIFLSAMEAQRETKLHHIHKVCTGIRKSCGGYYWKYI